MRPVFVTALAVLLTVLAGCGADHSSLPSRPPASTTPCTQGVMGGCVPHPHGRAGAAPTTGRTLIPDVSEFQGCPLHSEAIFRVYEAGLDREDFNAACHARELARLHAWAGVYAFLRASRNCIYEADRTIAIVKSLPVQVQVIVGDAETGIREGKVACFLREIERQGYPAVEYTCPGCGDEQHGPVWIAAYPFRPAGQWVAHQFSSEFDCRGIVGDCSVDEGILGIHRVNRAPVEARIRAIRRWLVAYGCRRRVARHEHLGPRCLAHFAEGERKHRELAQ